ncbi:hypothetical protein Y046_4944 [Burkholderia pseudomallei MSHR2990]|nr:hypothetical protein Y046_4944 [Burkholderia pseudomallei MSHR2990]
MCGFDVTEAESRGGMGSASRHAHTTRPDRISCAKVTFRARPQTPRPPRSAHHRPPDRSVDSAHSSRSRLVLSGRSSLTPFSMLSYCPTVPRKEGQVRAHALATCAHPCARVAHVARAYARTRGGTLGTSGHGTIIGAPIAPMRRGRNAGMARQATLTQRAERCILHAVVRSTIHRRPPLPRALLTQGVRRSRPLLAARNTSLARPSTRAFAPIRST